MLIENVYSPKTKFAKVMFSQVSVCPQGGLGLRPGGLCPGGSLSEGSLSWGSLLGGGLCPGKSPVR